MTEVSKSKPENFLPWAILVTILCCLPTGVVAIVYANRVDSLWFAEKYDAANNAAKMQECGHLFQQALESSYI